MASSIRFPLNFVTAARQGPIGPQGFQGVQGIQGEIGPTGEGTGLFVQNTVFCDETYMEV